MRWPIRFQLLLPNLSVVVLAIILATGTSAYFGSLRARQAKEESLKSVVATLTEAKFPLTESVLEQMSGLSGAEFVLFDQRESLKASTLQLTDIELVRLLGIPGDGRSDRLANSPTVSFGGRAYLGQRVAVAAHEPLSSAGSLVVLYPQDRWWAAARQAAYPAIIAGAVTVAAVVLVTTLLAHRFVQPIHRLRQRAAAIAQGDFQPLTLARRNDEIRDLALSINQMSDQLSRYESQVRRNEQLRTLGQLGAGMAHQLRNAATGGRMAIELHQRECDHNGQGETLDVALRQLRLMESYLQRFLAVGRAQPLAHETICLATVAAGAVGLARPTCIHTGVELVFRESPTPLWICGDADALRQLILNLVLNAVEAVGEQDAGTRRIVVEIERLAEDRAALHVRDTGPGPAAAVADRLFEPFVSSKAEGTGLGLYVARQVAEAHHGALSWQRAGGETCFSVVLPLIPDAELGAAKTATTGRGFASAP